MAKGQVALYTTRNRPSEQAATATRPSDSELKALKGVRVTFQGNKGGKEKGEEGRKGMGARASKLCI